MTNLRSHMINSDNYVSYVKEKMNSTYLLNPWCKVLLEKLTGL